MGAVPSRVSVSETIGGMGAERYMHMGEKVMRGFYGKVVKAYISAMVMSHSRKEFLYFQTHKRETT